ncbi:MAG: adenosylcobinamide-GDP ribazoletransferase [Thermoflexales bacterium]|nr:adenosylcobinamide-GDP ribazoletransferase [Thermoflexales bacterium]MCS7325170.1 adenosylcobinamide-GDP ribazoletransferase [Thermoflexales bacterium]MCX7938252.1 adenosylcobinamide-GDP ribazoletransferase [Thermoflexales bacterium]MDW8053403.1 adenosylcobinamide-GDP ribazoletransferase [Anaerolineae bacterium]MDW8292057.1 adenosylcobinamide-GDP ribazoletransferase [Anaerolineae bacterium]
MSALRGMLEALRLLTVLPTPRWDKAEVVSTSEAAWFPWVGLLLGSAACGVGWIAGNVWGEGVRAVVAVLAIAALSGGLHLDGLSDTFDALLSWRPREQKLAIMKDSRIGAMGALALIAVLALKIALVGAAQAAWWRAVLVATVLGRWAIVQAAFFFPLARQEGMAQRFRQQLHLRALVSAAAATALLVLICAGLGAPWTAVLPEFGRAFVALAAVSLVVSALAQRWTRELGGLTGDTYGALCEIAEVVALAAIGAWR